LELKNLLEKIKIK